jgi:hypothetical protein
MPILAINGLPMQSAVNTIRYIILSRILPRYFESGLNLQPTIDFQFDSDSSRSWQSLTKLLIRAITSGHCPTQSETTSRPNEYVGIHADPGFHIRQYGDTPDAPQITAWRYLVQSDASVQHAMAWQVYMLHLH